MEKQPIEPIELVTPTTFLRFKVKRGANGERRVLQQLVLVDTRGGDAQRREWRDVPLVEAE